MENYRTISLSRGLDAIVDSSDFEWLSKYRWHAIKNGRHSPRYYATRAQHVAGEGRALTILMHRMIMGDIPKDRVVDHINGNSLDNRRCNLRLATRRQNAHNVSPHQKRKSPIKGATWSNQRQGWLARITVEGNLLYMGVFKNDVECGILYDNAARFFFGEFAALNNPESEYDPDFWQSLPRSFKHVARMHLAKQNKSLR